MPVPQSSEQSPLPVPACASASAVPIRAHRAHRHETPRSDGSSMSNDAVPNSTSRHQQDVSKVSSAATAQAFGPPQSGQRSCDAGWDMLRTPGRANRSMRNAKRPAGRFETRRRAGRFCGETPTAANELLWAQERVPDDDLLSRARLPTIIGAESFHGPVRDGKEWDQLAMVVRHDGLPARLSSQRIKRTGQFGSNQEVFGLFACSHGTPGCCRTEDI
jgi:hypothetical protein